MLNTAKQTQDFEEPATKATGDVDLSKEYGGAKYDPKLGWSTATHTFTDLPVEEYIELAEGAAPDILAQSQRFMSDNGFSHIEIPIEAFQRWEEGTQNFREWLDEYCNKHGLDSRADFAIIGPRVKELESASRKTTVVAMPTHSVVDYLGVQFVALKQRYCPKNLRSLDTLERAMKAAESDPETIARKNYYWKPHDKTKFRGHKTLRTATVPEGDHPLAGLSIMAEVKLEHESQMDVDRATRKFIDIGRSIRNAQVKLINAFSMSSASRANRRQLYSTCSREERRQTNVDALGAALYATTFKEAGFDRFLDPTTRKNHPALSPRALLSAAEDTIFESFKTDDQSPVHKQVTNLPIFDALKPKAPGKPKAKTDRRKEYV